MCKFDHDAMLDALTQHFGALGNGEQIEIRAFGPHGRQREFFPNAIQAAAWIVRSVNPRQDVYFGVNPRLGRDGSKAGVSRILYAWADLDYKHFPTVEAAEAMVDGFPIPPTIENETGGGRHLYWRLADALDPKQAPRFERALQALYVRLGNLDGVQDTSRILRLPGTFNNKDDYGQPQPVRRIMYRHDATTTLEELERCLNITADGISSSTPRPGRLPRSTTDGCAGTPSSSDSPPPPPTEVATMLSFIEPCMSYPEYVEIWMGVASAYPGTTGLDLIDQWSSAPREANGQSVSPQTEPDKHFGMKREGITIGTVIHHAKQGGYRATPPPQPRMIRRTYQPEYRTKLEALPDPTVNELPLLYQHIYEYLGGLPSPFSRDFTTGMIAANVSTLLRPIKFENLNCALWFLGVAEQGVGKNRLSGALYNVFSRVNTEMPLFTSGTPEGMWSQLEGEDKQLYCYHTEYAGFLALMGKDHMSGSKDTMCQLYDGEDIGYTLSKKRIEGKRPYVTVVATTTHTGLKKSLHLDDLRSGYMSRFLIPFSDAVSIKPPPYPSEAATRDLAGILRQRTQELSGVCHGRWDTPNGDDPACLDAYARELGMGTGEVRLFEQATQRIEVPEGRLYARVKKLATSFEWADAAPQVKGNTIFVREEYTRLAILQVRRWAIGATAMYRLVTGGKDEQLIGLTCDALIARPDSTQTEIMRQTHADIRDQRRVLEFLIAEQLVTEDNESGRVPRYRFVGRTS